jgi:hypothetical protein
LPLGVSKLISRKVLSGRKKNQKETIMARGGTNVFCPQCKAIRICAVVPLYQLKKPKARNWQRQGHHDIHWFRRARRCSACGHRFLSAELNEKFVEELVRGRELLARKNRRVVKTIRERVSWLRRSETIPLELAKRFIEEALYWDHPSGGMVSVPGFSNRIYKCPVHGWSLELGANTILVGKAIDRCKSTINRYLERAATGLLIPQEELEAELKGQLRGSIANINGEEYIRYPDIGGQLQFGTHFLDLAHAAEFLIKSTGVSELCVKSNG